MSEFQYYEFLAIDRPLTAQQQKELRAISTRARITASSFTNTYEWGDLKADPLKLVECYFDAHVYAANWGSYQLILRVPKAAVDVELIRKYCVDYALSVTITGEHLILYFSAEELESDIWMEPENYSASLIALRSEILAGDYRCLYLAWLAGYQHYSDDNDADENDVVMEPPIPPGLKDLSPALCSFAEFFGIDDDMIAEAAETSPPLTPTVESKDHIAKLIVSLKPDEKNDLLRRWLCEDEAGLRACVLADMRRAAKSGTQEARKSETSPRPLSALQQSAAATRADREKREEERCARELVQTQKAEAEKRRQYLETLAATQKQAWRRVETMIEFRETQQYDKAVALLLDLREVAEARGDMARFNRMIVGIRMRHTRKTNLIGRLDEKRLGR